MAPRDFFRGKVCRATGVWVAALALLLTACGDDPTLQPAVAQTQPLISDAVHNGGVNGFYFLAPLVPAPHPTGVFERHLSPVVKIDHINPNTGVTISNVATFTRNSGWTRVRVNRWRGFYIVRWRTASYNLDTAKTYRIRVIVAGHELGFADIDVVGSNNAFHNVDRNEFVPLRKGGILPIKFRIEKHSVDSDGDGVFNWDDNCPSVPNGGSSSDSDGPQPPMPWGCDYEESECDPGEDDCTPDGPPPQLDTDGDGVGDACECVDVVCAASDQCHSAGTCDTTTGTCSDPAKPNGVACDDGDGCTQSDTCQAGSCNGSNPVVCTASDQCHDAGTCNPSTGTCSSPAKADGFACDDGDACTQSDTCQAGSCNGNNPVVCTASDQCHDAGTCNPSTGTCSNPAKADGFACNDGDGCTQSDTCQAGSCNGSNPVVCTASDQCHDAGTCNPSTGTCSSPAKADGFACDDGDACTQSDTCQAGSCDGNNPVVCTASDQCHDAGTCNPSTGTCSSPAKADGFACDDGDACTQSDTCQAGACDGNNPVVCAASDQCHDAGTCNSSTGTCSNPAKADGFACSDGDACTQSDTCQAGSCNGDNPVVCTASDQCHDAGTCNPSTGTCSSPAKADGFACDDGDACTQSDSCQAGSCNGDNPVVCTASDQCHDAGACNSSTGTCTNPTKADGFACDDGNACTQSDTCQAGSCSGESPVVCAASDQCHDAGTCDPSTGTCDSPAKVDGFACDDGNACTQSDTCQAGSCNGASPVVCTASDQCHDAGTCDPSTGTCSNPAKADGVACDDGNACTQTDSCDAGSCGGGNAVVCTASDQCHDAGTCNPSTGTCSDPAKADGVACNDGNACTQTDSCEAGSCNGGNAVTCTASDQCHDAGTCNPSTGTCSDPAKADGVACDDGNACTQSDSCQVGTCDSAPVVCMASDQCHEAGICDPGAGTCSNPAKLDGTVCDDGIASTHDDACLAGACSGIFGYTISGTVTGLAYSGLVLQNNLSDDLAISADGAFSFATPLEDGTPYGVSVFTQPDHPDQFCEVINGTGEINGADVTDVEVVCGPLVIEEFSASPPVVAYGGVVTLTWAVRGASSCSIDPGNVDAAPDDFGSVAVSIATATTFTLTCEGEGGPESAQVSVAVTENDWAQISTGANHTCGRKVDGRLFCWGANGSGQLGNGTNATSLAPTQEFTAAADWVDVAAGTSHTCAVKTDGRLFCWGSGATGRLGNNSTADSLVPAQEASAASDWYAVATGNAHTCAVKNDGRLFCWGSGSSGQLGNNATAQSLVPVQEITGATNWDRATAGNAHSCATTTDGRLFCWGSGANGRLGNNATSNRLVPTQEGTGAIDWLEVAAGSAHTCAVKTDGELLCWGVNGAGQLGTGTTVQSLLPLHEVTGALDWVRVVTGATHTCATKIDGSLFCWGRNTDGQLGDNTGADSLVPIQEDTGDFDWEHVAGGTSHTCAITASGELFCWGRGIEGQLGINRSSLNYVVPAQEGSASTDFAQLAAGGSHSCAVTTDGKIYCFGSNINGQLGTGDTASRFVAAQEATGATNWAQVAAGDSHTCAVKSDGRLFCWGSGLNGRLGNNSTAQMTVPVPESSGAQNWKQVAAGQGHTCAVKTSGRLFCWGAGSNGQLGNNSTVQSLVPVQESSGAQDWAQVAVGAVHTCAVKTDGRLFCWGSGLNGRLGNNSTSQSLVPVQEYSGATDWAGVSAGAAHTCAVKDNGRLYCWGTGNNGRLGTGTSAQSLVPVQEQTGATNWAHVAADGSHTCAVKTDGWLYCWGFNANGQLGDGSTIQSLVPVEEDSASANWSAISTGAGGAHTCGLKNDGRVFCWGLDTSGQLGYGRSGAVWPAD